MQPDGDPGLPASYVLRRVIRVEDSRREQSSGGLKEAGPREDVAPVSVAAATVARRGEAAGRGDGRAGG